jgi:hypothetical protein
MRPRENSWSESEVDPFIEEYAICHLIMQKLVTSHACALGVPEEYIFFPLLSCVAGAMGRTEVEINQEWREKCAIWCAVIGRRGSRRTATLGRFMAAAETLRKTNANVEEVLRHEAEALPELAKELRDDVHVNTILHEDLQHVFDVLFSDSKTNLSRMKRLYDANVTSCGPPNLNIAGFVVTENAMDFLDKQPLEMTSRFLVTSPPDVVYYSKDLKVPIPSNTPSLSDLFEVLWIRHQDPRTYYLQGTAKALFDQYYDRYAETLRDMMADDGRYSHVAKAPAQLARLSCVLCALRQALKYVVYQEDAAHGTWNFEIGQEDVEASKIIVDQVLKTKFTLLEARSSEERQDRVEMAAQLRAMTHPTQEFNGASPPKRTRLSSEGSYTQPTSTNNREERLAEVTNHDATLPTYTAASYTAATYAAQQLNSLLRAAAIHRSQLPVPANSQAASQHIAPSVHQGASEASRGSFLRQEYETAASNHHAALTQGSGATWPQVTSTRSEPTNHHGSSSSSSGGSQHQDPDTHSSSNNTAAHSQPQHTSPPHVQHHQLDVENHSPSSQHSTGGSKTDEGFRAFFSRTNTDQPLGFFDEDPKKFTDEHGTKLKKLLEFRMDYRISPSTCAQRHLIPPLSRMEMLKYDTQTKYPVQIAKEFLLKVAQLGFGSIETVIHPANKRRSSFFQKYPWEQLGDEARTCLQKLNVSEQDYMAAFLPNGGRDAVYGFPFNQSPHGPPSMVPMPGYPYGGPTTAEGHAHMAQQMLMAAAKSESPESLETAASAAVVTQHQQLLLEAAKAQATLAGHAHSASRHMLVMPKTEPTNAAESDEDSRL